MNKEEQERLGWMMLAQQSMSKIWDNLEEDKVWQQYLKQEEIN